MVITKYELNQRTFSDVNHISSGVSNTEYAKSKERWFLLSRISQSNGEGRHIKKAQQKAIGVKVRVCSCTTV